AAMRAVLERSRDALSQAGSPIRSRTLTLGEREALIFEPDVPEPRLGWAILGDTYVYGAGTGRLERTLRHLTGAPSKLPASLDATVAGNLAEQPNAGVVVVRAAELADAITRAKLSGAAASVL